MYLASQFGVLVLINRFARKFVIPPVLRIFFLPEICRHFLHNVILLSVFFSIFLIGNSGSLCTVARYNFRYLIQHLPHDNNNQNIWHYGHKIVEYDLRTHNSKTAKQNTASNIKSILIKLHYHEE